MPSYRTYEISKDNRVTRPSEIITCDDDEQAVQKAEQLMAANDVELWDGPRFVARIKS